MANDVSDDLIPPDLNPQTLRSIEEEDLAVEVVSARRVRFLEDKVARRSILHGL